MQYLPLFLTAETTGTLCCFNILVKHTKQST